MPCCAFAAFLLLQLLAPFAWLKRRFSTAPDPGDQAAAWRYGDPVAATTVTPGWQSNWQGKAAAVVAIEAAALVAALWFFSIEQTSTSANADWDSLVALHTRWCSSVEQTPSFSLSEESFP